MYLSQVELIGFKSFAHRTKITFDDGITAIVGPNGCGKTNIVDAIRWVLGEQKTSVLRSDRMENVIFNGTMNRRRLGYSEVVVDISNLLMDSGMGVDAYSVIELSMVEMILSDRDEYRKRLFEEASGITKYKARRQEALRKLEATRQDLVRVRDIINEVERSVNALKSQVNRAKRYEKFKSKLVAVEKQYYHAKQAELLERKKPIEDEINTLTNQYNLLSGKTAKRRAILDKSQSEILAKQGVLTNAQEMLNKFSERVRTADSNHAKLQERLVALKETIDRITNENSVFKTKIKENDSQFHTVSEDIASYRIELNSAMKDLERIKSGRDTFLSNYMHKKSKYLSKSQKIFDVLKKLEEKNRKKDAIIRDNRERKLQLERLKSIREKSLAHLNELSDNQKSINANTEGLTTHLDAVKADKISAIKRLEHSSRRINEYENAVNNKKISLESFKTKLQFLNNLVEGYGGLSGGVSAVLNAKDKLKGVLGTVGDFLSVPKEYRIAVESVLGEQSQYIIVDKWRNIQNAVDFLRTVQGGRATFIALDRIADQAEHSLIKPENLNIKNGSLLIEKITAPDNMQRLLSVLLGDVILIDDNEISQVAVKYSTALPCKIVNKNGEIISVGYMFTGGSMSKESTGIVGRKDRIIELEKEINAVKGEITETERLLEDEYAAKEHGQEDISRIDEKIDAIYHDLELSKRKLGITNFEIQQIKESIGQIESDIEHLELTGKDSYELDEINGDIALLQNEHDTLQKEHELFQSEEEALEIERQKYENQFSECNTHVARSSELMHSLEREKSRLQQLQAEYSDEIEKRKISLRDAKEQQKSTEAQLVELERTLEQLFSEQKEYEDKVLINREELNKLQEEKQKDLDEFLELQKQISTLQENTQKGREMLVEIQQEMKFLEDILQSKGIVIGEMDDSFDEEIDLEEIINVKQKLLKRMDDFGPVNMEALDEYNREHERLNFLKSQTQDLEDAEKTLIETIDKINKTARERFYQTFQLAKQNFIHIFRRFFGDGEADIKLEEGLDPLEAKIEIFAQPFGKRIQSIALLSGGEKALTAIAILFAIYRVKPSPFCILDEVDAPLDDANVTRFVKVLHEFSQETQFIVVTHNKKTMEAARNLYGVTMQESGISKIISVRIDSKSEAFEEVDYGISDKSL
ncbi:hypothetical protein AMJ80_09615 [bacterium SM23_31]|nr:MAG: hypothetical protein AMJ80_09615 [bacterium SM23_31]